MGGDVVCKCKPRNVVVIKRNYNQSAFNGYRRKYSDYSEVRCLTCGYFWRTKAGWVNACRNATEEEAARNI